MIPLQQPGYISSGDWLYESQLSVARGGTGASSLTDGGILLGSGTGAVTVTSRPTAGQLLIGNTTGDPTLAQLTQGTGITITNGSGSISIANALGDSIEGSEITDNTIEEIDLEADAPTDNYILSYDQASGGFSWVDPSTAGTNYWSRNSIDGFVYPATTTDDLVIGGNATDGSAFFFDVGNHQIVLEGATDDTFETTLAFTDPTADRTITFPNAGGEVSLLGQSIANAELVNSSLTVTAGSGLINGGSVSLGGSVTLDINTGNGVTISSDSLTLDLATSSATTSTSSHSGLEVDGDGLSLVSGCSDQQVLTWSVSNDRWECTDVGGVGGVGDITAVGSITSGAAFASSAADDQWLGLGASAGRIEFDDQATDEFLIKDALVGIGTDTPNSALTIESTTAAAFQINPFGASAGNTGEFRLLELVASGTNYTGFKSPDNLSSNLIYTLPSATGSADQVLTWNSGGVLTWEDAGSLSGAGDITAVGDAPSGAAFTEDGAGNTLYFEGATVDAFEIALTGADAGSDVVVTLPAVTGTLALGTGTTNQVAYWSGTNTLAGENQLAASRGGTGIDSSSATGVATVNSGSWTIASQLAPGLGGTGDDTSATTGVPYISSGDWLYESQLSVARGGTGASSLTDGGILLGSGTGAVTVTSRPTAGQLLIGNTTGDPTLAQLTQGTGITITNGSGSISIANALGDSIEGSEITDNTIEEIDLEADAPTDNYLLSYDQASGGFSWVDPSTAGTSYWSRNSVDGFVYPATTTDDLVIGGNATDGSAFFFDVGNHQIVLEGATDDTFETTLAFTDPTADRTITFPNAGGEVSLLGQLIDLTSEIEGALAADNGGTGDDTSATTGVPYISSGDWLYESQLSVARGGTGASSLTDGGILLGSGTGAVTVTSRPTAGQLLIGNTTGDPTLAQLTQGTGITITNGSGSISIANALGDSIEGSEITDGTIEEIDLEADAPTDNYILSYDQASGGFSWVDPSTAGTSYWSRNSVDGFVYPATTTDDLVIGGNATDGSAFFFDVGNHQIVLEGATDDTFETTLAFTDPTADRTITFPNAGGEVSLLGQLIDLTSEIEGTLAADNGGTGDDTSVTTGVPYISSGDWLYESQLSVARGGTGASSLTDGGILLGSGTGAVTVTSRPTAGQLLIGNTTGDPTLAQLTQGTGIIITNGSGSISIANALGDSIEGSEITDGTIEEIDLEADAPTDNYLLSYDQASGGFSWVDPSTAGTNYWSRNSVDGFVYPATTSDDLVIGGNATDGSAFFFDVGNHQIVLEGATDDTFETTLAFTDPTADRTITFPNAGGEVSLLGQLIDLTSEVENTLGAGNGGTGIDSSSSTGVATVNSGSWTIASQLAPGLGGTGDDTSSTTGVPYISSGDWLYESQLSVARGGTGASSLTDGGILLGSGTGAVTVTSRPTAGQLLIGNTTGDPTLAQLTQGTGITITNGSGSISIANALGDSIEGSEITDNTIEEIDLEADAPTDNYLLSYDQASGGFSWVDPSTAGTNYWSRNSVDGFVYPATTSDDLVIGGNATDGSAFFFDVGNHQIVLEGATDDTFETTLAFTDPTADRLITFPNAGGEVSLLGQLIDLTSEIEGTLAADNGGTGDDTSATTGVPYISSGDWLYESQLSVARGGTGASSLTDGGILLGSGTGAVTVTSRPTAGQLLIGNTTGDPTLAQLTQGTGITITNGSGSISIANALGDSIEGSEITDNTIEEIDLEADAPTDNYILSYDQASGGFSWVDPSTAGTNYWSRNSVDGFVYPATTTDDLVIGGNATDGSAFFFDVGNNQIVLEGATDDTFETTLAFTDPTADRTITFPNAGGEVSLLGQLIDLTSEIEGTLAADNGGTGDDTSATTGVPYISSGDWLYESQLSVARGGTGASSLTDGGILLGSGTGAVTVTSRPTAGQLLIGNTTGDPTLAQLTQGTGITITNGSGSISIANALGDSIEGSEITDNTIEEIDLEADAPTDNYILSYDQASGGFSWVDPSTAGTNYWSRNSVDGFVYPATTSDDLVIGGNATDGSAFFFDVGNHQIVLEGATDDTFETTLAFTDPTADRTITFPNAGGEVSLLGQLIDLTSEIEGTLAADNGGTGIDSSSSTGVATVNSGSWTIASQLAPGLGGTGDDTSATTGVPYISSGDWLYESQLSVARGGTGASSLTDGGILLGSGTGAVTVTSRPTAGQLLIGNTTGDPTLAQLTQGTGITITNGSGSISIANALGDSIEGSEITDNTIEEIDLEADAPTDNYLLSYDQASGGFSWVDPSTAGTNYWSRNSVDGFVYPATTTDDLVIGGNATDGSAFFFDVGNHQIVLEGATDDTFETTLAFTDPTADRTITFPNAGGEVSLLGQLIDLTSEIEGILAADNGGTGDDTSATTGVPYISSGDWLYESQLSVARGGTGASTLTDGGILLGSGTGAVTVTSRPTDGQLLIGTTSGDPVLAQLTQGTGITITNGSGSISIANALGDSIEGSEITDNTIEEIDLEANPPTDNYILSYDQASGGFTWIDPGTAGVNYWQLNSGVLAPQTLTHDLALGGTGAADGSTFFFDVDGHQIVLEGATSDTFETTLAFTDPTADRTITFPNAGGEVSLLGQLIDLTSEIEGILASDNGGTGDDTSATTGVPYISSGDWLYESQLSVARGGTGASTLTDGGILLGSGTGAVTATLRPTDGQLLIGTTSGDPVLAQLTQGTGITISNGSGSISIANALGDSIEGSEITDNTIEEIDLEANAPTDNYALTYDQATGGFTWVDPATLGTNYWQLNSGVLAPGTLTYDLAVGASDSTAPFFYDESAEKLTLTNAAGALMRLAADGTNYFDYTIAADGALTLSAAGTDADYAIDLTGATDGDFSINTDDLFVDTSAGQVGIGTTNVNAELDVIGDVQISSGLSVGHEGAGEDDRIYIGDAAFFIDYGNVVANSPVFSFDSNDYFEYNTVDNRWSFTIGGTEALRLNGTALYTNAIRDISGGNIVLQGDGGSVGIGDATPDHTFDVNGNIGLTAGGYLNYGDTDGTTGYGFRDNLGTVEFKNDGGSWTSFSSLSTVDGLWEDGTNGVFEDDEAVVVGADAAWTYLTPGVGDLRVASDFESIGDGYVGADLVVGASTSATETIAAPGFTLGGDDLFVAGTAGIEGNIYTDGNLDFSNSAFTISSSTLTRATGSALNIALGGAAGDDFTVDTSTLVVESDNNRVGIGDTTPDHTLDVAGNIGLDAGGYINYGDTDGTTGYGFRDNAGTIEFKNSAGSWTAVGGGSTTNWNDLGNPDGNLSLSHSTHTTTMGSTVTTGTFWTENIDSLTTGTGRLFSADALTDGTLLDLQSTSTALDAGSLLSLDWSPTGSTEIFASGDLFSINVGQYGNPDSILNLYDNGSSIFKVAQTKITSAVPHEFTAAGDVSIAYDLQFTNQSAATIQSDGPLTIQSGEAFENLDLTLEPSGSGSVVIDDGSDLELFSGENLVLDADGGANSYFTHDSANSRISVYVDGSEEVRFNNAGDSITTNDAITIAADFDIAETYPTIDENLEVGEVVAIASGNENYASKYLVEKTNSGNAERTLGIVSTSPGIILGDGSFRTEFCALVAEGTEARRDVREQLIKEEIEDMVADDEFDEGGFEESRDVEALYQAFVAGEEVLTSAQVQAIDDRIDSCDAVKQVPVTLAGRVPVKADLVNGDILAGDWVTTSVTTPGTAMKAVNEGMVIGRALETYTQADQDAGEETVMIFVETMWYGGQDKVLASKSQALSLEGSYENIRAKDVVVSSDLSVLGETTLSDTTVTGSLSVGLLEINNGAINNLGGVLKLQDQYGAGNIEAFGGEIVMSTNGDIRLFGTLKAERVETDALEVTSKQNIGSATIKVGQTELFVPSTSVKFASRVFLTPKQPVAIAVTKVLPGQGFIVQIDGTKPQDVLFDWLIVEEGD